MNNAARSRSSLIGAICNGNIAAVTATLARGTDDVNQAVTPLAAACQMRQTAMITA